MSDTTSEASIIPVESIAPAIVEVRGQRIILDVDLARLYGVQTKVFNQAVKRNSKRFPSDFMFQLTKDEKSEVVTKCDHLRQLKYSPVLPHAFTEHGAVMAASILNSPRAVEVSVYVVRAFLRLKTLLSAHAELSAIVSEHEGRLDEHDKKLNTLIKAIVDHLKTPEPIDPPERRIGFRSDDPTDKPEM